MSKRHLGKIKKKFDSFCSVLEKLAGETALSKFSKLASFFENASICILKYPGELDVEVNWKSS